MKQNTFFQRMTWFILLPLLLPHFLLGQNHRATIREFKRPFITYPFSDPNPIPVVGRIYPYYRFDGFTDRPMSKSWSVVELENDFLRVTILPEIGGKIWSAVEKRTGRSFLYFNQVVKFRDIAMRGPWTSGGIEANYGIIGHTPNCSTPVDYLTVAKNDSSVSCYIGALDLLTRTAWRIEINLPKDKAYFTTTSSWHNATGMEQPYYTWMNAGLPAKGNLQFIYPGTHYLGHGGEFHTWPMDQDNHRDLSFYENNDVGGYKSYHVFGRYTDFFGAYWHDDDFGMVRYAAREEKPGKKIWIWGLSQQGMIWEKLLTDHDGQYVEVQSGRLFNQSAEASTFTPFKHRGFSPYASDQWTEYWYPVRATKGMVQANELGALNVVQEKDRLCISLCPTQSIQDTLYIYQGDRVVRKAVTLQPLQTFSDSLTSTSTSLPIKVVLGQNKLLYEGDTSATILNRPLSTPDNFDWNSVYGLFLQGKEWMRQRAYVEAKEKLQACLKKDAHFLPALVEMAVVEYRGMRYQAALTFATQALSIDTYDPSANYYYGLINRELGHLLDSRDGFDIAAQSMEYRSSAFTELAKLSLCQRQFRSAITYCEKALAFNRENWQALQVQAIAFRRGNLPDSAQRTLSTLAAMDPLNHFVRFEKYLFTRRGNEQLDFMRMIRNEMPQETFLELAIWYYRLGCNDEAEAVLALAPRQPEVLYWLAFLHYRRHNPDYIALLRSANEMDVALIFPFRPETAEILKWAIETEPYCTPRYYLALILWSTDNAAQARDLFRQCGSTPTSDIFYAARAELNKSNAKETYLADLLRAIELNQKQWRHGLALTQLYAGEKRFSEALQTAQRYYRMFPDNYVLGLALARSQVHSGKYQQCLDVLSHLNVLPCEGATEGRILYKEARLMLAVQGIASRKFRSALNHIDAARVWPENLGVGKPYPQDVDERLEDWLAAQCYLQMKKTDQADSLLKKIISFDGRSGGINQLLSAWAWRQLGKDQEGEALLNHWTSREPTSELARQAYAIFQGRQRQFADFTAMDKIFRVIKAWKAVNSN